MEPAVTLTDLVRASLIGTLKKNGVNIIMTQCDELPAADSTKCTHCYQTIEAAFLHMLSLFEEQHGAAMECMFDELQLVPDILTDATYITDIMQYVAESCDEATWGMLMACASLLNHICARQCKSDTATDVNYVNMLLSTLVSPSATCWRAMCPQLICVSGLASTSTLTGVTWEGIALETKAVKEDV